MDVNIMDHWSLSAISEEPNFGIRSVIKRVSIVLSVLPETTIKENLIKVLDQNLNKYSPDIGGILLGYTNVKYSKVNFDWSLGDRDEIVTLKVKAKFILFSPSVGSILRCKVRDRNQDRINCLALGHFPITVYNPGTSWDFVGRGDVVLVELQVFSQMANTNPDIIGVIRQNESIVRNVTNLDDEIDTEDDVEHETLAPESLSQDGMSTVSSLENSQFSLVKRKHNEEQSSSLQASPVKKKSRSDIQTDNPSDIDSNKSSTSGIPEEVTLPSSQSSPANNLLNCYTNLLNSTNDTDPHSQSLMSNDPTPGEKSMDSSSKRRRSKEILAKILPRPKSRSSESENSNEAISPKKENDEDVNQSRSISISREASMDVERKRPAKSSTSSVSEKSKVPIKKQRNAIPEGFKDTTTKYRSKSKRIEAPNGDIFKTYKACWDFVERNPDYLQRKTNMDKVVVDKENSKVESKGEENITKEAETKESGDESASDSSFEEEPVKIPTKQNKGEDKSVTQNKSPLKKRATKPGEVSLKKVDQPNSSSVTIKKKAYENSSSSDSSSEEESDNSFEDKIKAVPVKKFEKNRAKETKVKSKKPSTPNRNQPQAKSSPSTSLITKHFSKTPKKSEGNAPKGVGRENLNDKVRTKKSGKSPQLSSTVSGNFSGSGKKKVELSEEISPILKRSKSLSSKADKSIGGYYDKILKTSKVGSVEAQSQPAASSGKVGAGDKSDQSKKAKAKDLKKKNKIAVAGFL